MKSNQPRLTDWHMMHKRNDRSVVEWEWEGCTGRELGLADMLFYCMCNAMHYWSDRERGLHVQHQRTIWSCCNITVSLRLSWSSIAGQETNHRNVAGIPEINRVWIIIIVEKQRSKWSINRIWHYQVVEDAPLPPLNFQYSSINNG